MLLQREKLSAGHRSWGYSALCPAALAVWATGHSGRPLESFSGSPHPDPLLQSPWLQGKAVPAAPGTASNIPRARTLAVPASRQQTSLSSPGMAIKGEHGPGQQLGERLEMRHQHLPTLSRAGPVEEGGHR